MNRQTRQFIWGFFLLIAGSIGSIIGNILLSEIPTWSFSWWKLLPGYLISLGILTFGFYNITNSIKK